MYQFSYLAYYYNHCFNRGVLNHVLIKNDQLRILLSRFRLTSHNLEIEIGRYNNISRDSRYCKMCTQNVTESEFHFYYVLKNIEKLE